MFFFIFDLFLNYWYIIIPAVLLVYNAVFVVTQQSICVIERFGRFVRVSSPGLNFLIPFVEKVSGVINMRIRQLDVQVETKTHDNVFVKILVSVQYEPIVDKVYEAFYKLDNPARQIEAFVFDVVRAMVPKLSLDDVFAKKDEIAISVRDELCDTMSAFGFRIVKALVTDIHPDKNVKEAMNEINTAQRLRMAAHERAEAEKIVRVKQAEAEAEANILHGAGIAGQRKAIIDGLSTSIDELQKSSPAMTSEGIMTMILMIQYFDMLRDIGAQGKSNTMFLQHSPSSAMDIVGKFQEMLLASTRSGK